MSRGAVQRLPRWYFRCVDCLGVICTEMPPCWRWTAPPLVAPGLPVLGCASCGGNFELIGPVEFLGLKAHYLITQCDRRCTHARGPQCNCAGCFGRDHGASVVRSIIHRRRGNKYTAEVLGSQRAARLRAQNYRRAKQFAWQALWWAFYPHAEDYHYARRELSAVEKLRNYAARVAALRRLTNKYDAIEKKNPASLAARRGGVKCPF